MSNTINSTSSLTSADLLNAIEALPDEMSEYEKQAIWEEIQRQPRGYIVGSELPMLPVPTKKIQHRRGKR